MVTSGGVNANVQGNRKYIATNGANAMANTTSDSASRTLLSRRMGVDKAEQGALVVKGLRRMPEVVFDVVEHLVSEG